MKVIGIVILVMLLIPIVSSAPLSSIEMTIISKGGLIVNSERSWSQSNTNLGFLTPGNQYNQGSTDLVFLTGPGASRIDVKESTNHSIDNLMDSSVVATSAGGYAYGHGAYMEDQQPFVPDVECTGGYIVPQGMVGESDSTTQTFVAGTNPSHQQVLIEKFGVGQGMYVESDIIVENANVTSSTRGEVVLGSLFEDIRTHAEVGFNKTSNDLNYEKYERSYAGVFGSENGPGQMAIDFKWRDHSHPYGIGADAGELFTINTTVTNST